MSIEKKSKNNIIDVSPWMTAIQRRSRIMVIVEQLQSLERDLKSLQAPAEVIERLKSTQEFVRGL
tara:strand:+ start:287 stop:481 length:195 start_codon:yes stop_codon:yes gene_type:complete